MTQCTEMFGCSLYYGVCLCLLSRTVYTERTDTQIHKVNIQVITQTGKPLYVGPCHHGMALPNVADGGDGFQI
jgi:hypothetical protein